MRWLPALLALAACPAMAQTPPAATLAPKPAEPMKLVTPTTLPPAAPAVPTAPPQAAPSSKPPASMPFKPAQEPAPAPARPYHQAVPTQPIESKPLETIPVSELEAIVSKENGGEAKPKNKILKPAATAEAPAERDAVPASALAVAAAPASTGMLNGILSGILAVMLAGMILVWRRSARLLAAVENMRRALESAQASQAFQAGEMRRVNRAYVYPLPPQRLPADASQLYYRLALRNYGLTPAYEVQHQAGIVLADHRHVGDFDFPEEACQPPMPLPPGGEQIMTLSLPHALSSQELLQISRGQSLIYIYGRVHYRDAFGNSHTTRYRLVSTGDAAARGDFQTAHGGNEAD